MERPIKLHWLWDWLMQALGPARTNMHLLAPIPSYFPSFFFVAIYRLWSIFVLLAKSDARLTFWQINLYEVCCWHL